MDKAKPVCRFRLNAGNDRNGNPRRVYIVCYADGTFAAFDEDYSGTDAMSINSGGRDAVDIGTFVTTPKQYRELVRGAK